MMCLGVGLSSSSASATVVMDLQTGSECFRQRWEQNEPAPACSTARGRGEQSPSSYRAIEWSPQHSTVARCSSPLR
jgi:hypothetical protein